MPHTPTPADGIVTINSVRFRVLPSGAVVWCSDWGHIDRLADQGHLTRHTIPGTHGHVTFTINTRTPQ